MEHPKRKEDEKLTDAELFAEFLENREVVAALRPWWRQGISIALTHHPANWSEVKPFSVSIAKYKVEDADKQVTQPHTVLCWSVNCSGETLAHAAREAASKAAGKNRGEA